MSTGVVSEQGLRDLEGVLDTCLSQLHSGVSLEACLAQHPSLAAELEPLLQLALRMQDMGRTAAPAPTALRAGRQQLLLKAEQMQAAERRCAQPSRPPAWLWLQPLLRRGMATVVLASLLLALVLGRGAASASAKSLPGDVLYPVKRISEEVRLLLTFDWQVKAAYVRQLEERRREEAMAIADSQRVVEMSFRGQLDSVDGQQWTVSGVQFQVAEETIVEGQVALGARVLVRVRSLADGTLLALQIAAEPEMAQPLPTASPSQVQPTHTPEPSLTLTEVPPTAVPLPPIEPPIPSPTLQASSTAKPTSTATATPTATMIPTTLAPPREVKVRFQGNIEAISTGAWTIGGRAVKVDERTRIDEGRGSAVVGAVAMVLALPLDDGSLLALEITIQQAAQAIEQPFEFQGLIESFGPSQWVVGGYTVFLTGDTVIENSPQRGLLAEVKAVRRSDGTIVARRILVLLPTERVQFEGVIQTLSEEEWLIEGVVLRLDAETVISGLPVVGAAVEVDGLLLPDGAVLARYIVVQAPATATPTAQPQDTPSAPGDATLTLIAEASSGSVLAPLEVGPADSLPADGGTG